MGAAAGKTTNQVWVSQTQLKCQDSQEDIQSEDQYENGYYAPKSPGELCNLHVEQSPEKIALSPSNTRKATYRIDSKITRLNRNHLSNSTLNSARGPSSNYNSSMGLTATLENKNEGQIQKAFQERWIHFLSQLCLPASDKTRLQKGERGAKVAPEYSQEIYESLLEREKKIVLINVFKETRTEASSATVTIRDRFKAMKRLIELCTQLFYSEEILHTAIAILDRAIELSFPKMDNFQLTTAMATSLVLSAKLFDNSQSHIPAILSKLSRTETSTVNVQSIVQTERIFLIQFDFEVDIVTSYTFLQRFLELMNLRDDNQIETKAKCIMLEYKIRNPSNDIKPSVLAAASLYYAQVRTWNNERLRAIFLSNFWNASLEHSSKLQSSEISRGFFQIEKVLTTKLSKTKRKEKSPARESTVTQQQSQI